MYQQTNAMTMMIAKDPDGIEEGNAILDAMEQAEELDRIAKAAGK